MKSTTQALRKIALFDTLPDHALARVAQTASRHTYAPDEIIIVEGLPCKAAYFIAEGKVRVVRTSAEGREQVLTRLGPGQSFNTVPLFRPEGVNHATVQAIDETTLYAVAGNALRRLTRECPDLALALLGDFAERLDHLTDLVEDLSLRTVRGRLARFLVKHAEGGEVRHQWTQAEIAARLGTVREMIGRTLRSFADEGLIRIERQRIELLDREGLVAEVHG